MTLAVNNSKKIKYAFLSPVGSLISGKNIKCYLELQKFASKHNFPLLVMQGRTHADARNALSTGGHGFLNPYYLVDQVENFIWIDSDHYFESKHIEQLMNTDYPFCAGWYLSHPSAAGEKDVAAGYWDPEYFKIKMEMRFLDSSTVKNTKNDIMVDFTGFGFVKINTSLFKSLDYPFFRHDIHRIGDWEDNSSEDVSFCLNVYNKTGIKPMIISSLKISHLKEVFI